MLDDVSDGLEAFGLTEVDALGILDIADELYEVERVDVDGIERGVLFDLLRLDGEVVAEDFPPLRSAAR